MKEIPEWLSWDKNAIGYEELIDKEIIHGVLNLNKFEEDKCDESGEDYPGVSHADLMQYYSEKMMYFPTLYHFLLLMYF